LNEHVETAELLAYPFRRLGDRRRVRHVELEGVGVRPDLPRRSLASSQIARPHQNGEAVSGEILGDLETDPLVGPSNQGDGLVLHDDLTVWFLLNRKLDSDNALSRHATFDPPRTGANAPMTAFADGN
jgi:hypothetical protein